jgi:hypothetical protein
MNIITAKIKALRISKASAKEWTLYGPIDQALKTSIQAEAVCVVPLHVAVHGEKLELELWINAQEATPQDGSLNGPAVAILAVDRLREQGVDLHPFSVSLDEESMSMISVDAKQLAGVPKVNGPAILTGAGGADLPDTNMDCLLHALMGGEM